MEQVLKYRNYIIIAALSIVTFVCFKYTINNQFTCWDDDYYVTNDPYIKALTADNLKVIFTTDITKNNFHPFCMFSLALNYYFSQMNPQGYYLTNIIIHIINTILVFFLILMLCRRLKIKDDTAFFIATLSAFWFGPHPMRVESVSWIAERKDVLYAFFYFLALMAWMKYTEGNKDKWKWYGGAILLFIASCLSKPMAVVLPFSLLAFDFLLKRRWTKEVLTDKIAFCIISLVFGGFAVYTQNKAGAIADFGKLTVPERIMYGTYGFDMYMYKFFSPTYLSTFYPYPYRYITGFLPAIYYAAPFLALGIPIVGIVAANYVYKWLNNKKDEPFQTKKNRKKEESAAPSSTEKVAGLLPFNPEQYNLYTRVAVFGFGYLAGNLVFVLQFISVGAAIMADRYSYVAYVGFIFMVIYFINEVIQRLPGLKLAFYAILLMITGWFAYLCYERTYVWHDSETLLSDAIEKYPMRALLSYKWLGNFYLDKGELDKAMENYGVLTMLHAADAKVWDNVGNIYIRKRDFQKAIDAFNQSLGVQNNVYKTYLDRALAYTQLGDSVDANRDLAIAYQLNPSLGSIVDNKSVPPGGAPPVPGRPGMMPDVPQPAQANKTGNDHLDSCILQLRSGDTLRAFRNFILAYKANPGTERILAELGFNYVNTSKQFAPAVNLYNMLLKLNSGEPHYYFYRGVAYYSLGKVPEAKADWLVSVKMNSKEVQQSASNNLAVIFESEGDYNSALKYAELSKSLGYGVDPAYLDKLRKKAGK